MKQSINTLKLVQKVWAQVVKPGDHCLDATAGRGHDTKVLAELVGPAGRVTALDIQPEALSSTAQRLEQQGLAERVRLVLDSHAQMKRYAQRESVALIVFNLGYLPGGDHRLATKGSETIAAIGAGLELLRDGGVMTLCIYHGGDSGFDERDQVLAFLQTLDDKRYTVLVTNFHNRPHHPPIAVIIYKGV